MKQILILCSLLMCLFTQPVLAQGSNGRVREAKVALIKERLNMTPTQEKQFWPIFDRYENELRILRRSYADKFKKDRSNPRDKADAIEYVNSNLEYQEKVVEVKRKYKAQFLKVISNQQLAALYEAEREFKQMLIRQLREN